MCVSDHMGLQNRVGRPDFFCLQYFFISGLIYIMFLIYDPQ